MAQSSYESNITPSILDRLLDDDPGNSRESATSRLQNLRALENAVARDLEALLNTKQESLEDLPPEFTEVSRSLVLYGLPDFTSLSLLNTYHRDLISRAVERAVAIYEPRLQRVKVTMETARESERGLRFRIDALLRVDPAPEPVTFDAVLQLNTQQYLVKGQT
jgi:type VI secretion system protein ImpF